MRRNTRSCNKIHLLGSSPTSRERSNSICEYIVQLPVRGERTLLRSVMTDESIAALRRVRRVVQLILHVVHRLNALYSIRYKSYSHRIRLELRSIILLGVRCSRANFLHPPCVPHHSPFPINHAHSAMKITLVYSRV